MLLPVANRNVYNSNIRMSEQRLISNKKVKILSLKFYLYGKKGH